MKVIVGMSGGVDSSIAAYLLKREGYEVIGAYFKMLDEDKGYEEAQNIALQLNIPLIKIDIRKDFKNEIIKDFISQYKGGFTPNPCVKCNEKMKFGLAFDKARDIVGNAFFATGHYAIIEKNDRMHLKKAKDGVKDQSYMLWRLKQNQLKKTLFPLGTFTKKDIYKIAGETGLKIPQKESQDICFINGKLRSFLKKYLKEKRGEIVDVSGTILGEHAGAYFYTVGQRSGLGISHKEPLYVVRIDIERNRVVVGKREECYFKFAELTDTNFIEQWSGKERKLTAKVRYRAKESPCILRETNGKILVEFSESQFAIAPGQSLVMYKKDYVFGGGIIKKAY